MIMTCHCNANSLMYLLVFQRNVFKQPSTDLGKKSKKGQLSLQEVDGKIVTIEEGKGDPNKVSDPFVLEYK